MGKDPKKRKAAAGQAIKPISSAPEEIVSFSTIDPTKTGIKENAFRFRPDPDNPDQIIFEFVVPDISRIKGIRIPDKNAIMYRILTATQGDGRSGYCVDERAAKEHASFEPNKKVPAILLTAKYNKNTKQFSDPSVRQVTFVSAGAMSVYEAEDILSYPEAYEMQGESLSVAREIWENFSQISKGGSAIIARQSKSLADCIVSMASMIANYQAGVWMHKNGAPGVYSAHVRPSQLVGGSKVLEAKGKFFSYTAVPHQDLGFSAYAVFSRPLRDPVAVINSLQLAGSGHYKLGLCADMASYLNYMYGHDVSFHALYKSYGSTALDDLKQLSAKDLAALGEMYRQEPLENKTFATLLKEKAHEYAAKKEWSEDELRGAASVCLPFLFAEVPPSHIKRVRDISNLIVHALTKNDTFGMYCLQHAHEYGAPWKFEGFEHDELPDGAYRCKPVFLDADQQRVSLKSTGKSINVPNANAASAEHIAVSSAWQNFTDGIEMVPIAESHGVTVLPSYAQADDISALLRIANSVEVPVPGCGLEIREQFSIDQKKPYFSGIFYGLCDSLRTTDPFETKRCTAFVEAVDEAIRAFSGDEWRRKCEAHIESVCSSPASFMKIKRNDQINELNEAMLKAGVRGVVLVLGLPRSEKNTMATYVAPSMVKGTYCVAKVMLENGDSEVFTTTDNRSGVYRDVREKMLFMLIEKFVKGGAGQQHGTPSP